MEHIFRRGLVDGIALGGTLLLVFVGPSCTRAPAPETGFMNPSTFRSHQEPCPTGTEARCQPKKPRVLRAGAS